MLAALDAADRDQPRSAIGAEAVAILTSGLSRSERSARRAPLRDRRKRWSELLAGATATMIAHELREHRAISRRFRVAPAADGTGQETFWPLGYRSGKRIDVVVAGELSGLQLGVSLKGLNFRDDESGNYDKNLTGRLYRGQTPYPLAQVDDPSCRWTRCAGALGLLLDCAFSSAVHGQSVRTIPA